MEPSRIKKRRNRGSTTQYPYILVCNVREYKLYRHLKWDPIPDHHFKVLAYRTRIGGRHIIQPYDMNNELKEEYWTLPRTGEYVYPST